MGIFNISPAEYRLFNALTEIATGDNFGKGKKYNGVLQSLTAFVCKKSFEAGFNGEVAFTSKTTLIRHYEKAIHARLIYPPNRMAIFSEDAHKLVSSHFKNAK